MSAPRILTLCAALSLLPLSAVAQTTSVESVTSTITNTAQGVDSAAKKVDAVSQTVDQANKAAETVKKALGQDTATSDGKTKGGKPEKNAKPEKGSSKTMPEKAQKYGNSAEHRMDDVKKQHGKKKD